MFRGMQDTRPLDFCPGDILIFSGRGIVPRVIQTATCSPYSHVGMVANVSLSSLTFGNTAGNKPRWSVDDPWFYKWTTQPLLFESTTMAHRPCAILNKRIAGVQAHRPANYVNAYKGRVWRMRLTKMLQTHHSRRLTAGLLEDIGTPYDAVGAVLTASWLSKRFWFSGRARDRSSLLCVEYLAKHLNQALYQSAKLDPGQLTPGQLVRELQRTMLYEKPKRIR